MFPILFRWGNAALQTYPFLVSIAYLVGIALWVEEGRRKNLKASTLINLSLLTGIASWIGARGLFVITQWPRFVSGEYGLLRVWEGGVVFLGGLLAAALLLWWAFPRVGISRRIGFDTLAPAVAFAHAIGRLACFANGCCHGRVCDLPWAVVYTNPLSAAEPLGVPLQPSQLYEMAGLIALGFVLLKQNRRANPRFTTTQIYLVGYGVLRFFNEFTRGDTLRGSWEGLSTSQWISLGLILTAVFLEIPRWRGHNSPHESRNREPVRTQ
jgi:phosphatidylglycerol:prolipoprotein diacylglycerol transferase